MDARHWSTRKGHVAQLAERPPNKREVGGSIPPVRNSPSEDPGIGEPNGFENRQSTRVGFRVRISNLPLMVHYATVLPNDEDVQPIWQSWRATGSYEQRNKLIVHYAPLVRHVATRMAVAQQVDEDDLVSTGTFGLIDAIDRFNPDLGNRFSTFAIPRIRGKILDELRVVDWAPRTVRANSQAVASARELLSQSLGRTPTNAEVATAVGVDGRNAVREAAHAHLASLDDPTYVKGSLGLVGASEGQLTIADTLVDDTQDTVGELEVAEIRDVLAERLNTRLDDRSQIVLALYYNEGLTLEQVGTVFGVTESRICQLHMQAMEQLRS